jgi:hypothetical protein
MKRVWIVAGAGLTLAGLACVACASVLGIPNDTASFCSSNTGHTYCEDFDLGDPLSPSRMSYHAALGGAQLSIAPSDDSPPNLIDCKSPGVGSGGPTLAGFDKEFDDLKFGAIHIEADMRIVTSGKGLHGQAGFLIVSDKQGGCVGVALGPQGIGAVTYDTPGGCGALVMGAGGGGDAATGGDGGAGPLHGFGGVPPLDQWNHIKADVTPSRSGDGSGTFTFDVVGELAGNTPLMLAPKTLTASGAPLVGFSAAGIGPGAEVELQFDNITVDVSPP